MKGVILAGGEGTRLRPVTYEIPKPLVTVKKKPIVNHLIEFFFRHGVDDITLIVSGKHRDDFLRWEKNWKDELPLAKITIVFEEKPRGTFGGVTELRDWLGDGNFVLSNGDELKDFDLSGLISFHEKEKPLATVALVPVASPNEYGVPILDGHHIKEFLEKPEHPPSNFVSSGLYVLDSRVLDYADASKEFIMIEKDIFPALAKEDKFYGVKFETARWYDCGNLERWEKAIKEW